MDLTSPTATQRGETSGYAFSMGSHSQIHAGQPATVLLTSQNLLLGASNIWSAGYTSNLPPIGFPVRCNPIHDRNSSSETVSNAITSEACPFQFIPVTPEKNVQNERPENNQFPLNFIDFYNERVNQEKEQDSSLQSMSSLFHIVSERSEGNVGNERAQNKQCPSKFRDFSMDETVNQETKQDASLRSRGSLFHFALVSPEKNVQNERTHIDESSSKFIDFCNERLTQEKEQDGSLGSGGSLFGIDPARPEENLQNERARNNQFPSNFIEFNTCERVNQEQKQGDPLQSRGSFQFAPVTPEKNAQNERALNNQSPSDFCIGERINQESEHDTYLQSRVSPGNEVIEICCEQGPSQSSAIRSSQLQEIPKAGKGEIHVIDLNKTPQQRPKKKKHRPKVIRETKTPKTPKAVTPKQAGAKENASRKKRSLRKQSSKESTTPLAYVGESVGVASGAQVPSCRRALNFELEAQASYHCLGASEIGRVELGGREDGSITNLQIVKEPEVENPSSGISFDLNLPVNQSLSSLLKRKIPLTENSKILAKKINMETKNVSLYDQEDRNATTSNYNPLEEMVPANSHIGANCGIYEAMHSGPKPVTKSCIDPKVSLAKLLTHTEPGVEELNREYGHTACKSFVHGINPIEGYFYPMQAYLGMVQEYNQYLGVGNNYGLHCPQIYRKQRTKKPRHGIGKLISEASSISMPLGHVQSAENFPESPEGVGFPQSQAYENLQALSQTERKTKKRSKTATRARNLASFSALECNQMLVTHSKTTKAYVDKQGNRLFHRPQPCMEALVGLNQAKLATKKRTKRQTHVVNSMPFSCTNHLHEQKDEIVIYDDRQSFVESTSVPVGRKSIHSMLPSTSSWAQKFQMQDSRILPANSIHDCRSSSNLHETYKIVSFVNFIDDIVQRLQNLNIHRDSETTMTLPQNALVPYAGDGKMVPYEGPFDPRKKRRPRPKVELDMETLRQWKLLMLKDSSEVLEGTDEEKEKWWEEERRIFRGRVDSFIARMHLVQGDRRFSQWKGSVVDSVVGVFLTQNVSDHLSSSAFMSLAARFPPRSKTNSSSPNTDEMNTSPQEQDVCVLEDATKWQEEFLLKQMSDQSSITHHEAEPEEAKEMENSSESFGSNILTGKVNCLGGTNLHICDIGQEMCQESAENRIDIPVAATNGASLLEPKDWRCLEDMSSIVSSQNSTDSTIQTADRIGLSSESNSEAVEQITTCRCNSLDSSTSFMELLHMAESIIFPELRIDENNNISSKGNLMGASAQFRCPACEVGKSVYPATSIGHERYESNEEAAVSLVNSILHTNPHSNLAELTFSGVSGEKKRSLPSNSSEITEVQDNNTGKRVDPDKEVATEIEHQLKLSSGTQSVPANNPCGNVSKHQSNPLPIMKRGASPEIDPMTCNSLPMESTGVLPINITLHACSYLPVENTNNFQRKAREADCQVKSTRVAENGIHNEALAKKGSNVMQQADSSLVNYEGETLNVVGCARLVDHLIPMEGQVESSSRREVCCSEKTSAVKTNGTLKAKKVKATAENRKVFDWENLRKQMTGNRAPRERSQKTMDSLDWEAVRCAEVDEIAHTIRERGMNNVLAGRIKDFLNRLVKEHGSIDLEWLRDIPPDKTKDYLLSIRGLGLKSVECVRLLALQHLAFPVDTNVGRICVRLGWVPLQPLPESLQLHLLELYPVLESIQKYLWPRLCKLDQRTLYELHYQLITFGKVFCTKSRPNCNACPMRGECKHFASAFASARLALPGPEEKSLVSSVTPMMTRHDGNLVINPMPLLPLPAMEANSHTQPDYVINNCEPIIEEPTTPEPDYRESLEGAVEEPPNEDPDEIPTIKLNLEELTLHIQNYIQENKMEIQDTDTSKALVTLTPEAASIPMPKLKNVSRLRTEHQVYELPDTHPLLEGLDPREPDDPCSYLLAIWTPGETAESIEPPEVCCNSQALGGLCNKQACFGCNSIREANAQTVRGTLLIPCRTAMRGSFPLNGTYFQVNEVFADHDSSLNPIDVPRAWIWNLPRRTVFFGTSIPTIFRGLTMEGIQYCFWRGFVCVRGIDQKTRAPRPLMARLHFPASKLVRTKKTKAKEE